MKKHSLLKTFPIVLSAVIVALLASFALVYFFILKEVYPEQGNSEPIANITVYGRLNLKEIVDSSRSGLTKVDLHIEVDFVEKNRKSGQLSPGNKRNKYRNITWIYLKNNMLNDDGNYVGIDNIPSSFKLGLGKDDIKIGGKIYERCINEYVLMPTDETKPKINKVFCDVGPPYHIRLSEYKAGK